MSDRKIIYLDDAIDALKKEQAYYSSEDGAEIFYEYNHAIKALKNLPSAQPEITLLHAAKIVLKFIESCGGTTVWLITPDGDRLSCDWGYVEDGLRELVRYAERREE